MKMEAEPYLLPMPPLPLPPGDLSASDTSLADLHERHRGPERERDMGLMPLPDTDESSLDWTHLVDAANVFEGETRLHRGELP